MQSLEKKNKNENLVMAISSRNDHNSLENIDQTEESLGHDDTNVPYNDFTRQCLVITFSNEKSEVIRNLLKPGYRMIRAISK